MPSKVIIIVIEFMFLGVNIFWALLRARFNPRLTARAKMSLSRAQNIFMPANINSIVLLVSPIIILSLCYWDSDQLVQKLHCFWVKTIIVLCTCTIVIEIQSTAVRVKLQGFGSEHAQVQLGKFELEL